MLRLACFFHLTVAATLAVSLSCSPHSEVKPQLTTPTPPAKAPKPAKKTVSSSPNEQIKTVPPKAVAPTEPITPARITSGTTQAKLTPKYQQISQNGIQLSFVRFDDRTHHLQVADQPNGTGTKWSTAKQAGISYNALAAINGGFFTPEGGPLGIVTSNGTRRGSLNHSSLGAGFISSSAHGSSIFRKSSYSSKNYQNLLQTGPMLVERGSTVTGLSQNNERHRSFIASDGRHHWLIGYASPCSLNSLAKALTNNTFNKVKIKTAINLDGGRSSDLWVSSKVSNGNKTHRTFINKKVRNYLVLTEN